MTGWLIEPRSTTEKAKTALDVELDMVVNGVEPMSAYLLNVSVCRRIIAN
jgi:hypothetical protein